LGGRHGTRIKVNMTIPGNSSDSADTRTKRVIPMVHGTGSDPVRARRLEIRFLQKT